MIEAFKQIGMRELEGLDETGRIQKFLSTQAINPGAGYEYLKNKELPAQEIVINLDTKNNKIEIELGDELVTNRREIILAFQQGGAGRKKMLSTNNLNYHTIGSKTHPPTIPALIDYIEDQLDVKGDIAEFVNYLKELRDTFYHKWLDISQDYGGYFLNYELMPFKFRQKFDEFYNPYGKFDIASTINVKGVGNIADAWTEFVSKEVIGSTRKNDVSNYPIFSIKVNGQYLHEGEYRKQYLKIISYDLLDRFFQKSQKKVAENALCSACNEEKDIVTGKIDISTKFYGTTANVFFENIKNKNAYKSFAVCKGCYEDICVGISKIEDNFLDRIFSVKYYLIPTTITAHYEEATNFVQDIIKEKAENLDDEWKKHKRLIKVIKRENVKFDFLFFYKDQASFIVVKHINDVYYKNLETTLKTLSSLNYTQLYSGLKNLPNINSLYWLLFPNYQSHANPDPSLYRKELLELLDSVLKGTTINYKNIISKFNFILRKTYFKQNSAKNIIYRPLKMNILLSFFNRVATLQGGFDMASGNAFTEIASEDVKEFFSIHSGIYGDNYHRQGLVLLGNLINSILNKQRDKSSDFFSKLNLDGLPARRVKKLISEVTHYLKIYEQYKYNSNTYAAMMDRIQGIEDSKLSKDEVIFYILTGISLDRYLGYKYSQEKKENEEIEEEE